MTNLFTILADFGLEWQDHKHRKNVKRKERRDGKRRTAEKHLFKPSNFIYLIALIIVIGAFFLIREYNQSTLYPKKTEKEMAAIANAVQKWKDSYDIYPNTLEELIKKNPTRKGWAKDAWKTPYVYEASENSYSIRSAGGDGIFNTEDDIHIKN